MSLGMEVGLGPGDFVLDGEPAPPLRKGSGAPCPIVGPFLLWPNGWMHQNMPLGMEVGLSPGTLCSMGTQLPPEKRAHPPTQFLAHVYCGQTAGWMKSPLGTEADLGPDQIVLDGVPAIRERGTAAPLLLAHVCCGHGRPSQLLLSSC